MPWSSISGVRKTINITLPVITQTTHRPTVHPVAMVSTYHSTRGQCQQTGLLSVNKIQLKSDLWASAGVNEEEEDDAPHFNNSARWRL